MYSDLKYAGMKNKQQSLVQYIVVLYILNIHILQFIFEH
jgi:hypothetical protein